MMSVRMKSKLDNNDYHTSSFWMINITIDRTGLRAIINGKSDTNDG